MKGFRITVILAGLLVFIPVSPFLTLADETSEKTSPAFSIERLSYQLNDFQEKSIHPGDVIDVAVGDTLTLKKLVFITDVSEKDLRCWAEAYLHDGSIGGEERVDYKNGRTASHRDSVSDNKYTLTFDLHPWILGKNHDRVTVTLVHQYGRGDKDFKAVDTISIPLISKQK